MAPARGWRLRSAPLAGAGTRPRPTGSEPGPREGGHGVHCAKRARPGRLRGGNPQTLRGGRVPSQSQPHRAAELGSSPAAGAASDCGPRAGACLLRGHPAPALPGPPGVLQTPEFTPSPRQTRLPPPGPGQGGGIHRAGGKLVERLQSPVPDPGPPVSPAPRPRGPQPATYLLPRPARGSASQSLGPVRRSRSRARAQSRSRSREQPGAGRRAAGTASE